MQKQAFEVLEKINEKSNIKHSSNGMILSLVEEIGEVARELSKKQSNYREDFDKQELGEELADVLSRIAVIATDNDIDLDSAVINKFEKVKQRFEIKR